VVVAPDAAPPRADDATSAVPAIPLPHWRNDTSRSDPLHALYDAAAAASSGGEPDDVAFLWAVIGGCLRDTLRVRLSGRLYPLGWSQGAKLAAAMACAPRHGFAAAALGAGAGLMDARELPAARCAAPVPLLLLQGGADVVVPFCDDGLFYRAGACVCPGRKAPVLSISKV
jgi:hypothetical protein